MIFQLNHEIVFPNPSYAELDGLLAVGGDLSVERLLLAYKNGIFPWYSEGEPILWYAPRERFVLNPTEIKISNSLQKKIDKNVFKVTENKCFEAVVSNCATVKRQGQRGTWITDDMKRAYLELHKVGRAKSIEVWRGEELVGGLYGVDVGTVFCGESMFQKVTDASKVGLVYLATQKSYKIIDCQVYTPHLESMGAETISFNKYITYLKE